MRIFSVLTAILVSVTLYLLVFERDAILAFAAGEDASTVEVSATPEETPVDRVSVVALASTARAIEQVVLVRGRTEAARQVDVRAETNGAVIFEPLRKGAFVEAGELLCRIDPGTRGVSLAEAEARLGEALANVPAAEAGIAEARARVPEARARLAEALAGIPTSEARLAEAAAGVPTSVARLAEARAGILTAEARLAEALANVPAAAARLAEAEANVPAVAARLAEARARLPEAEARVSEAKARLDEAKINLNAAINLAEDGFASETRVAAAKAATESARAGVQAAMAQSEGARAGVQSAISAVEGAKATVENAKSQVEGAKAAVQSAKGQVENAKASVQSAMGQVEAAKAAVQSAKGQVEGAKAAVQSAHSQVESAFAGLQSAKSTVESARAGVQSAEASVAASAKEIERLEIHAPFAGLLESDTAELGSLLQPGGLCATIIQLNPIKLVGFVPEIDVDKVVVGTPAGARLATGHEVVGQVSFLSRSADPDTRTFRVEVLVPNADLAIRDGQTAEIVIQADGQPAHLIPQSALTLDNEGTLGVRIVDADENADFLPITVLRDTTEGMFVSGLGDSANVIIVGQEFVTDGVPVAVTYREVSQ